MPKREEGERDVLARLIERHGEAPPGQIWAGDDAALVASLVRPLISTDLIVEGVHVDRRYGSFSDMGFKAVSVNVSDIAAMGGVAHAIVVAIAGATASEIFEIMHGAQEAADHYGCDIVGGDLTNGATLVIAVTALGECVNPPIRRGGARVGDTVYVTGPLGASSAGLRELQRDPTATSASIEAHRRPVARTGEGLLLGAIGAHAAVDCSDGLADAVHLLAECSGVRIVLESLPTAEGATREDVLEGGEDYELVFSVSDDYPTTDRFVANGFGAPLRIGRVASGPAFVEFEGGALESRGFEHRLGQIP